MTDHPITPPPELVEQWTQEWLDSNWIGKNTYISTQAARWGADQELEACLLWVGDGRRENLSQVIGLRDARRPKPPSLKEQALTALSEADQGLNESEWQQRSDTIRRALEALPE